MVGITERLPGNLNIQQGWAERITTNATREPWSVETRLSNLEAYVLSLPLFKHVLDRRFINHQIRLAVLTVHLDAIAVVPLNNAVHLFTVAQHDHHRRPRLHLLLVVKILGVGLLGRGRLFPGAQSAIVAMLHAFSAIVPVRPLALLLSQGGAIIMIAVIVWTLQYWADELPIPVILFVSPLGGWNGIHDAVFHSGATSDTHILRKLLRAGTL